jgi:sugar lactone lactonase YvrE
VRLSAILTLVVLGALALALAGCGSGGLFAPGGPSTTAFQAIVPDFGNNRVLIYNQPLSTGMAANIAIGQPDFVTTTSGGTASTLNGPNQVTVDGPGNLYVADTNNNRVLQFKNPVSTGMSATIALGQPDLTTVTSPGPSSPSATTLDAPTDVASDPNGNIWVADFENDRVVKFAAPLSSGMSATVALGQIDLASAACAATATGLCTPVGVAFDASANIWVADTGNNRVVRFPAGSATGAAATIALGQPDLTSNAANNGGLSASTLNAPDAVMADADGNVWVADTGNNRVLLYKAPITTGMAATVALGQPDLISGTANQGGGSPTAATLSDPSGLQVTDSHTIMVGDTGNNRSVLFTGTFATNMNATTVLGQTDFVSSAVNQGGSAGANTQSAPFGAGPSLIALLTLALLAGAWFLYDRRRRRAQEASAV